MLMLTGSMFRRWLMVAAALEVVSIAVAAAGKLWATHPAPWLVASVLLGVLALGAVGRAIVARRCSRTKSASAGAA